MEQAIYIILSSAKKRDCEVLVPELRRNSGSTNRIQEVRLIRAHSGTQEEQSNTSKRPKSKDTPRYPKVMLQAKIDPAMTEPRRKVPARKDYLNLLQQTSRFSVLKLNWINGFEIVEFPD